MAYYNPNLFGYNSNGQHPFATRGAHHPAHPFFASPAADYGHPSSPAPHFATPTPASYYEDEERAALAHLRAIQQRRQEAEALAARQVAREEAYARHIQREREAAIRAEVARQHAAREQERQQERERTAAVQAARARAIEEHRACVRAQAQAQAQAKAQAEAAAAATRARQTEIESHLRAAMIDHERQQRQQQREAALAARTAEVRRRKAAYQQWASAQAVNAAKCAGRCARQQVQQRKDEEGWKELNSILEQVFGVAAAQPEPTQAAKSEKKEDPAPTVPAPAPAPVVATEQAAAPATAPNETKRDAQPTAAFPDDLNSILGSLLGLRVDPLAPTDADSTPLANNGVPQGLNELLSQFGLVFEPEEAKADTKPAGPTVAEASTSSASSTQAKPQSAPAATANNASADAIPAPAPLTSFLQGMTDLPPFVRDILENVEIAFREHEGGKAERTEPTGTDAEVQGKGKGVADGEKPKSAPVAAAAPAPVPSPAPVPAPAQAAATVPTTDTSDSTESGDSTSSLQALDHIADELSLATASFTFPAHLSFSPSSSEECDESSTAPALAPAPAPALLFNRANRPYHAQAHKLLQLLLQADGVSSGGDRTVRQRRKEVVKSVERAIEEMEKKRDEAWAAVLERRARGEESDDEADGTTTSGSSVTDGEIQHIDHVEARAEEAHQEKPVDVEPASEEAEGFDIETVQPTEQPADPVPTPADADAAEPAEVVEESKAEEHKPEPAPATDVEVAKESKEEEGYELL